MKERKCEWKKGRGKEEDKKVREREVINKRGCGSFTIFQYYINFQQYNGVGTLIKGWGRGEGQLT